MSRRRMVWLALAALAAGFAWWVSARGWSRCLWELRLLTWSQEEKLAAARVREAELGLLEALIEDPDAEVRRAVALRYRVTPPPEGLGRTLLRASREDADPKVRTLALGAVIQLPALISDEALARLRRSQDITVRITAIAGWVTSRRPDGMAAFERELLAIPPLDPAVARPQLEAWLAAEELTVEAWAEQRLGACFSPGPELGLLVVESADLRGPGFDGFVVKNQGASGALGALARRIVEARGLR